MTTATTIKERPIPFSAPMVRALLAGTKTQTRRILKPQDAVDATADGEVIHLHGNRCGGFCEFACGELACPYGQPGDRLWVKEALRVSADHDGQPLSVLGGNLLVRREAENHAGGCVGFGRYRHARFMPRRFARIILEITDVRVQALQEISEEDAQAEGIDSWGAAGCGVAGGSMFASCRVAYSHLWEDINGAGSWDANPYVWAISFRRVTP